MANKNFTEYIYLYELLVQLYRIHCPQNLALTDDSKNGSPGLLSLGAWHSELQRSTL